MPGYPPTRGNLMKMGIDVDALGSYIYVNLDGDDTTGLGTKYAPFATIAKAFTRVTTTRKIIKLDSGEYEPAASLNWPDIAGVQLHGATGKYSTVIVGDSAADQVISVAPTISGTFEMWMTNIHLDHDTSGQDGLLITNDATNGKLLI